MTKETEIPAPDYEELVREATEAQKWHIDDTGIYFFYSGHRIYPHTLTLGEIDRNNRSVLNSYILQLEQK